MPLLRQSAGFSCHLPRLPKVPAVDGGSGTRADSAIIASLNADTKQIKLTSILRDAYAYWETTPGDESTGKFDKINAAMSTGDIHTYINAVENLYKIKIDNYVIVNFTSFEKIIDTLGGVELELTSAEINEINNHQKRYGNVYIEKTFDGNKGTLKPVSSTKRARSLIKVYFFSYP